jgi:hypothetical protein
MPDDPSLGCGQGPRSLDERLQSVRDRVAEACRRSDRDPDSVTTIVITKFQPASLVRALYELGVRDVGENRHQEAQAKAAELSDLDELTWHFVGQLQSNKAKQVTAYSRVVHSVDRDALADALANADRRVDCFLQINLTENPERGGVSPQGLESLAEHVLGDERLRLLGVMAVAPLGEEPRSAFSRLRELSGRLQRLAPSASAISAGMSQDFPDAIAEGATHLRIGTAITGNRPARG